MNEYTPDVLRPHPFQLAGRPRQQFLVAATLGWISPIPLAVATAICLLEPAWLHYQIWWSVPATVLAGCALAGSRGRILDRQFSRHPASLPPQRWLLIRSTVAAGIPLVLSAGIVIWKPTNLLAAALIAATGGVVLGFTAVVIMKRCVRDRAIRDLPGLLIIVGAGNGCTLLADTIPHWPAGVGFGVAILASCALINLSRPLPVVLRGPVLLRPPPRLCLGKTLIRCVNIARRL